MIVQRLLAVFNILYYYMVRPRVRLIKKFPAIELITRLVHWGNSPRQMLLLFHFHTQPRKPRYQVAAGGGLVDRMNKKNSSRIISHPDRYDQKKVKSSLRHYSTVIRVKGCLDCRI